MIYREHCKKIHSSRYNCCICQKKYDGTSKAQIEQSRIMHEQSECCVQQDYTRPEFMTKEQEKIFDRSVIQNGSKSAEEKWHTIYKYLFPYTEQLGQPPSPCTSFIVFTGNNGLIKISIDYDYMIPRHRTDMLSDALHEHNAKVALQMEDNVEDNVSHDHAMSCHDTMLTTRLGTPALDHSGTPGLR
jgi:hypothetical protein